MKKVILFLIVFTFFNISAQLIDCNQLKNPNFVQPPKNIHYNVQTDANSTAANEKYVFNVKFHIVKETNGTGVTANFGEAQVLNAIMILNTNFNQFNIFFKYIGFDVIKNSLYTRILSGTPVPNIIPTQKSFTDLVLFSKTASPIVVYDDFAMNLFIVDKIDQNGTNLLNQVAGVAYKPGIDSAFSYDNFLAATLPHEIGHNFDLFHTWEGWNTPNCEHVSGDNWQIAGDEVQDTPASHQLTNANNTSVCSYTNISNTVDCLGVLYVNVPNKNFMASNNSCRQLSTNFLPGNAEFTPKQGIRMRQQINAYINNDTNPYGYNLAQNTIESLYEPFATIMNTTSGNSTTSASRTISPNDANTGVNIWKCPNYTFRFQKGLNWVFKNYHIGTVTKIVTDQFNYTSNNRGLFVKIPLIDPTYEYFIDYICSGSFEAYSKGSILSTTTLGSSRLETKVLSKTDVANPNLIDEFQSGKYYIITKETESGYQNKKTIYKN